MFFAEYGFLFSFGASDSVEQSLAQPIINIQAKRTAIHITAAATDHQTEILSKKCKTSKTAAGISPSRFKSMLNTRQIKKLPVRLVLLIFLSNPPCDLDIPNSVYGVFSQKLKRFRQKPQYMRQALHIPHRSYALGRHIEGTAPYTRRRERNPHVLPSVNLRKLSM